MGFPSSAPLSSRAPPGPPPLDPPRTTSRPSSSSSKSTKIASDRPQLSYVGDLDRCWAAMRQRGTSPQAPPSKLVSRLTTATTNPPSHSSSSSSPLPLPPSRSSDPSYALLESQRAALHAARSPELAKVFSNAVYVGIHERVWLFVQAEETLWAVHLPSLCHDLFRQFALRFGTSVPILDLVSDSPSRRSGHGSGAASLGLPVTALLELGSSTPVDTVDFPASALVGALVRHRSWLFQLFGVRLVAGSPSPDGGPEVGHGPAASPTSLSETLLLTGLPELIPGWLPPPSYLAPFVVQLARCLAASSGLDVTLLQSVAHLLGTLYSASWNTDRPATSDELAALEWVVQHLVLRVLQTEYWPSARLLRTRTVRPIAHLKKLFTIFERC